MLRTAFRALAKISPSMGHLIRESYFTLNGWRFADLKQHMNQSRSTGSSLALDRSFAAALSAANDGPRIAFVSCLPPMDTGISTCSLYSWLNFEGPVDIFAPAIDMDWHFAQEQMLRGNGAGPRLFDVGAFMTLDQVMQYDKIVIAIGNSSHHAYIFDLLRKISSFGATERVVLYIHDPCLLNIVSVGTESSSSELVELLGAIYKRPVEVSHTEHHLHLRLAERDMLGIRFFYNIGITRYLVNSEAAHAMVSRDLAELPCRIDKIFHPVFLAKGVDSLQAPPDEDDALVIGTFGITDYGKRIDDIADAVRLIQAKGIKVRLLIAGFHVRNFFESNPEVLKGLDHEIFDSPTDRQLVACMQKCHIAIQLRRYALGESSGIVPQLFLQGKTVLVSNIGAFSEYGEAAVMVEGEDTPGDIAEKLMSARSSPIDRSILERYCRDRSPKAFQKRFMELYGARPAKIIGSVTAIRAVDPS